MTFASPEAWIALLQIIGVNIVLSGDNAVVIALAARDLPPAQQKRAVAWGSGAAVVMRIVLTIVAVELLRLPWLKLVGAGLLLWIALQLLLPEDGGEGEGEAVGSMASAIKTILIADLVMSLDNVIAVAAAAKGNTALLVTGLAISIPMVVFASQILLTLMERYPIIITLGAGLLGWVAGEMAITDPVVKAWVDSQAAYLHYAAPAAGALAVVLFGRWLASRALARRVEAPSVAAEPAGPRQLRKILLAVDGSDHSQRALEHLLALRQDLAHGQALRLHLVNVQRPVSSEVAKYVPGQTLDDYHRERSDAAMSAARQRLDAAGIAHEDHQSIGEPGATIAETARAQGCDLIVMGARGLGTHTAGLVGSVAQDTLAQSGVPVLLVK